MSYREPPRRVPNSVVRYPSGRGAGVVLLGVVMSMFIVGGLVFFTLALRSVTVTCVRGGGGPDACVITKTYLLIVSTNDVIRLSTIHGAHLLTEPQKNGATYDLAIDTDGGAVEVAFGQGERGVRERQKSQLVAFLRDPQATSLVIDYDGPSPVAGIALGAVAVAIAGLCALFQRATVTFDWSARRITLTRTRFPLRKLTRAFALQEVRNARVLHTLGGKGEALFRCALILVGGEEVPLRDGWENSQTEELQASESINALCVRRDREASGAAMSTTFPKTDAPACRPDSDLPMTRG